MKTLLAALALLFATVAPAFASPPMSVCSIDGTHCQAGGQYSYMLLGTAAGAGAVTSGTPVGPLAGGSYVVSVYASGGAFAGSGCTVTMKVLQPDGVTFAAAANGAFTAPGTAPVVVGSSPSSAAPNVRMDVSGTCTNPMWATLGSTF